ncbi:MAG: AAA family ATPase, partial [Bryobacteraceae bacterium]|nr:AAA family ATPase [Bryobacteraceae bacterium]
VVDRTIQREETHLDQVLDHTGIVSLKAACRGVEVAAHVKDYAVDLVMATQPGTSGSHELATRYVRYGSSPRGAQALVECGRVLALMRGRVNLSIDDIREVAPSVLRHRIILNFDAHADGLTADGILKKIVFSITSAVAA